MDGSTLPPDAPGHPDFSNDRSLSLPPQFIQSLKKRLITRDFAFERFDDLTNPGNINNLKFQKMFSIYLDNELDTLPNASDYLDKPIMPGIDDRVNSGDLTRQQALSIKERTRNIMLLNSLLGTEDFKAVSTNEAGVELRRLIMALAREPESMYGSYEPSILMDLSAEQFTALTRKVLAVNITKKFQKTKIKQDYPRTDINVIALRLDTSLRKDEKRLIQATVLKDGYLKQCTRNFMYAIDTFDYKPITGVLSKDILVNLQAANIPISVELLIDFLGADINEVTPEIRSVISEYVKPFELPPGSGRYKITFQDIDRPKPKP